MEKEEADAKLPIIDNDEGEDTPEELEDAIEFTKAMRIATRKIHSLSDSLVNAKLSIGKLTAIRYY